MRIAFGIALLLAAPAVFAAITFGQVQVAPGTAWTQTSDYGSSYTIPAIPPVPGSPDDDPPTPPMGGRPEVTWSQHTSATKTVTVVEIGSGHILGSVLVSYASVTQKDAAQNVTQRSDVTGKQYLVRAAGNSVEVTYPGGGTPSAEEIAFVAADNDPFRQFLAYKNVFENAQFEIGVPKAVHAFAGELVNAADDVRVDELVLTLLSVTGSGDERVAHFELTRATLGTHVRKGRNHADPDAPGGMKTTLAGSIDVTVANPRIVLFDAHGTVLLEQRKEKDGAIFSQGTGDADVHIETAYLQ